MAFAAAFPLAAIARPPIPAIQNVRRPPSRLALLVVRPMQPPPAPPTPAPPHGIRPLAVDPLKELVTAPILQYSFHRVLLLSSIALE